MTIRISATAFAIVLASLSTATHATDLSYTYAELRFVDTEIGSQDGDGLRINGSFELNSNWVLVGGFTTLDFDGDVDSTTLEAGAGYIHRYSPKLDLVGYGKVVHTEVDFNGGDADDTGISLAAGVRGLFTPQFEGRATVNYINVDDTDTFFEVGGDYHFNQQFSAGASIDFGGDADTLTIGVRWFFGS